MDSLDLSAFEEEPVSIGRWKATASHGSTPITSRRAVGWAMPTCRRTFHSWTLRSSEQGCDWPRC
jgi:hypothetical protein